MTNLEGHVCQNVVAMANIKFPTRRPVIPNYSQLFLYKVAKFVSVLLNIKRSYKCS